MSTFDNSANGRRKRNYTKHERAVASQLSGVRTVGSGAKGMKGDVWAGDPDAGQRLMVECKVTEKDALVLQVKWLEKLAKEATESRREPILAVRVQHAEWGQLDFGFLPLDRYIELDYVEPPRGRFHTDLEVDGQSMKLVGDWFALRRNDISATVVDLRALSLRRGTPRRWAMLPLERVHSLYAAEALLRKTA